MASRLAHLTILDALFVALAVRRKTQAFDVQRSVGAILSEHRF
jgi:DNA-binding MurR/RpiR family transcriptional regulator